MKKRVKTKWLKALRSGEYKQTTGALCHNDAFCCLGVLCDVAAKNGVAVRVVKPQSLVMYDEALSVLPASVREWAGLDDGIGAFHIKDGSDMTLIELNDSGKTFKQIANYIERYF